MSEMVPPWRCPAATRANGGGSNKQRRIGKPLETMGRKARG